MNTDRVFGIAAALLSLLFLAIAVPGISGDWQSGADARYFTIGPRFFPYIAGTLTLVFAILIAIHPSGGNKIKALTNPVARRNVILSLALSVGYVALLDIFGFILATAVALVAFFLTFGERRWFLIGSIAIGVPVATEYAFLKAFMLELPSGLLELAF